MSMWTYVNGVIKVDTYARTSAEAMYIAQTVVNHLPKISGSENDVRYYLNLVVGHNVSSNRDEFDQPSNLYNGEYFRSFETQTQVLITVDGGLRDRDFKRTLREATKAISRLSSRLRVNRCLVSVHGYEESYVFDDPKWVVGRDITDWVNDHL